MSRAAKTRPHLTKPRIVFRGCFCTVEHRTATYPSGAKKTFEHIRRIPSVSVLAISRRGHLLLIREYREALGRRQLTVPGGRADKEHSPRAAAQRELREETGQRARRLRLLSQSSSKGYLHWPWYVYLAESLVPDPLPQDEGEDITIVPTPLQKAYAMALDGTIAHEFIALAIIRLYHQRKRWLNR